MTGKSHSDIVSRLLWGGACVVLLSSSRNVRTACLHVHQTAPEHTAAMTHVSAKKRSRRRNKARARGRGRLSDGGEEGSGIMSAVQVMLASEVDSSSMWGRLRFVAGDAAAAASLMAPNSGTKNSETPASAQKELSVAESHKSVLRSSSTSALAPICWAAHEAIRSIAIRGQQRSEAE